MLDHLMEEQLLQLQVQASLKIIHDNIQSKLEEMMWQSNPFLIHKL